MNFFRILSACYIGLITLSVSTDVHQIPQCTTEPYGFDLVLIIFLMLGLSWVLGYSSNK